MMLGIMMLGIASFFFGFPAHAEQTNGNAG